jgi:hypothetical protein
MFAANSLLLLQHFLLLSPCTALPATLPDSTSTPSPTPAPANTNHKDWPKSKQVGVIVGCIIGGAIILFLWGWILKGNKMFRGNKVLWLQSHVGSAEGRRTAREQRLEGKRRRREERDRFWSQPARTRPTRAQLEMEAELGKAGKACAGGEGANEVKT